MIFDEKPYFAMVIYGVAFKSLVSLKIEKLISKSNKSLENPYKTI